MGEEKSNKNDTINLNTFFSINTLKHCAPLIFHASKMLASLLIQYWNVCHECALLHNVDSDFYLKVHPICVIHAKIIKRMRVYDILTA